MISPLKQIRERCGKNNNLDVHHQYNKAGTNSL